MSGKLHFDGTDANPIEQGATFRKTFLINKAGLDLATVTSAKMAIRTNFNNTLIIQLTLGSGITIDTSFDSNGTQANSLSLLISADDTADLPAGEFLYDIKLVTPSRTLRLLEGEITITPAITVN